MELTLGRLLGLRMKFQKHLARGDEYRLKDYVLGVLEGKPFHAWKDSPFSDELEASVRFLLSRGWKLTGDAEVEHKFYLTDPRGDSYSNRVR